MLVFALTQVLNLHRGHPVILDKEKGRFVYYDTGEEMSKETRPCTKCGWQGGLDEVDGCLGRLPGVKFACCGHGDPKDAYIAFENGVVVRGFTLDKDRLEPNKDMG